MTSPTEHSRIATPTEATEVAGLLDRFHVEFAEYTPGAAVLAPRIREHIVGGLSVFVLAGSPHAGIAQLRFREHLFTGTPVCYLEELYVVPEHRGQGHGRVLAQAALELAREHGATTVELGTAASDTAARGLYESLGFTNLEQPDRPQTQMLYYELAL